MRVPLQAWYDQWVARMLTSATVWPTGSSYVATERSRPCVRSSTRRAAESTNLIYYRVNRNADGRPFLSQVHFVRDELASLLWCDTDYYDRPREPAPREDYLETAWVIGEHRSKSIRLPVYSLERPDKGIQFVLRDNLYNWKLSVISEQPIDHPLFPYLFHTTPPVDPAYTGNELAPCYFEGFPAELIFGYQAQNHRRWSAQLGERSLWTTILICMQTVGVMQPIEWHTKESHRAELDAMDEARKRFEGRAKR